MAHEPVGICPTVEHLPASWQVKSLGSLCTKIGTGATPRGGSDVYVAARIRHALIRSQHVFDRRFDASGLAYISPKHAVELRNAEVEPGDILLNITGDGVTFGRACIVPESILPACVNQHVSIIRPRVTECDPGYLLSVLTHPATKGYIESFNSGGSRRAITKGHIESFGIPLPSLVEQQTIAAVLGGLDDKIESNRRMNATLEAMARALFQSWFVDFDPVRAKLDGRQPWGLDPSLAGLFPDSFQESEVGQVPLGWSVQKLSDIMTFQGGTQPPASDFRGEPLEGYVRLVQIRDFYTDSHVTYVPDSNKLRKFGTDDIMLARYGSSGNASNGTDSLGRVCRGLSGAYNVALVKVVPLHPLREFIGCFLKSSSFQGTIKGMGARSVQSGFRKEDLGVIPVVIASPVIHEAFEPLALTFWKRIYANTQQSGTLTALRNTLLPKLLSGEIRLKTAERMVEAAI